MIRIVKSVFLLEVNPMYIPAESMVTNALESSYAILKFTRQPGGQSDIV